MTDGRDQVCPARAGWHQQDHITGLVDNAKYPQGANLPLVNCWLKGESDRNQH
jgi:hypothetical protein